MVIIRHTRDCTREGIYLYIYIYIYIFIRYLYLKQSSFSVFTLMTHFLFRIYEGA